MRSSPHSRRGALWDAYRKHYGKDGGPVLVWQAATRDMNPSVPQSFVDAHLADDPARGQAEYMAQFRSDLETFVLREAVEACVSVGVRERPPQPFVSYTGFADPSGGSADSFALCIGHKDHGRQIVVVDALRGLFRRTGVGDDRVGVSLLRRLDFCLRHRAQCRDRVPAGGEGVVRVSRVLAPAVLVPLHEKS